MFEADERSPTGTKHPLYGVSQSPSVQPQRRDNNSNEKPILYCHKFQDNTCTRTARECLYVYEKDPTFVPLTSERRAISTSSKPVTQQHRQHSVQTSDYTNHPLYHAAIGRPNGRVKKGNEFGFSIQQRKDMRSFASQSRGSSQSDHRSSPPAPRQHSNDARQHFTSWSDESKPGYSPKRADIRSFRVEKRKHQDNDTVSIEEINEEQQQWLRSAPALSPLRIELDVPEPIILNSDRPRSLQREEPQ